MWVLIAAALTGAGVTRSLHYLIRLRPLCVFEPGVLTPRVALVARVAQQRHTWEYTGASSGP
jgi:hypothetical protein